MHSTLNRELTINIPFHPAINPFAEDIRQKTHEWVVAFELIPNPKLLKQLEYGRFHELTARCYPNSDYETLQVINDWMTWLFILDDMFDEERIGKEPEETVAYCTDILNLLSLSLIPETRVFDPMFFSLLDLWQRTQMITPDDWLERFILNMGHYFEACIWEASNRLMEQLPATEDYIRERRKTGGVAVFISWSLITEKMALPIAYFNKPVFHHFFDIVGDVLCWTNDLVSLQKELASGDLHNVVLLHQRDHDCSVEDAVAITKAEINRRIEDYVQLEQGVLDTRPDADVLAYLGVLRSLMRGNLDWSLVTGRY